MPVPMAAHADSVLRSAGPTPPVPGRCDRAVAPGRMERAFTLVELVIACVLLAIVVAVAAKAIIDAFTGAADTASGASGKARAAEAATRFGADLRAARSIGRDGRGFIDPVDLRLAIETDGVLKDIDGNVLDWRDIIVAQPDRLTFQSDVIDETAGAASQPECVTWQVVGGGSWHVRRETRAYSLGCAGGGGAVLEADDLTEPTTALPRPGTGGTTPLFQYVVAELDGANGCRPSVVGTATGAQRNRITSVRIDFSALAQSGREAGRSQLRAEVTPRSRAGADYQFALGCDE